MLSKPKKNRGVRRAGTKRVSRDANSSAAAGDAAAPDSTVPGTFPSARGGGQQPRMPRLPFRRPLKNWRVRSRLVLLVIIPTVTAVSAGGIFIASSAQSALVDQRVLTLANLSGKITGLVQALQTEREDTVQFIVLGNDSGGRGASPSSATPPGPELGLLSQDYAVATGWADQVKALAGGINGSYSALAQQDMQAAVTAIGNLPAIRAAATGTQLPALNVIDEYATVINTLLAVESQIAVGSSDSTLAGSVRVLGLVSSMKEEASQQQALLTSALKPVQGDLVALGEFGPTQQLAITDAQAQQQGNLNEFATAATADQRQLFNNVLSSAMVVQAQTQEQQAISLASSKSPIATDPTISDASTALSFVVSGIRSAEQQLANSVISRSGSLYDSAITSAVIFSLAVALLLGIALTATTIIGRSMVRPLRRLRNGALDVAGDRLPEMVRRMSETDWEGASTKVEPIDVDSSDEIGEVARAFDQVHQEAVRLAGNEAMLRGNVSAMFISLSRRSVPLIGRLARMIDSLEQTEDDPDRLSNLFSMDHLVTRMRRNSENLLVLAGEEPVRKWSEPVPLSDVVRAATSEIEQYSRVLLNIQPGIVVSGQAAADVVHLLAEIIENATMFSPRDTSVHISGQEVISGGVLLEVRDNGVGIAPSRLAEINWRLDNPPVIDVSVSQRMGLFAVSRLAARHGVRVRLRAASPQGVSAMVWMPGNLTGRETVQHVEQRVSGRRASGRHAALGLHTADGGQRGGAEQLTAAATGRTSNWFRAKRPSDRSAQGADLSVAALGAADSVSVADQSVPAAGQSVSAAPATWNAFGGFKRSTAAHSTAAPGMPAQSTAGTPTWQASGPDSRLDDGMRAAERARMPVHDNHTEVGLPVRVPGANLIPGSVGGRAADDPITNETQASGRQAGSSETEQVMAPRQTPSLRRSPELARNRLGGFQLGSREAESEI